MTNGAEMLGTINIKAMIASAAIIAAFTAGWTIQGWRMESLISQINSDHAEILAKSSQEALEKYRNMETRKQEALNESQKASKRNADAAAVAAADADRLRSYISSAGVGMPTATASSVRDYATTAGAVLAECISEVEGMAKKADGHAVDSRTLMEAWPK
jgi:ElaB/YqjD/DUF883 family membrane-anchored ribosome-binding protein